VVQPDQYRFSTEECALLHSVDVLAGASCEPTTAWWDIDERPLLVEEFEALMCCVVLDPYTAGALLCLDPHTTRLGTPVIPVLSLETQRCYEASSPNLTMLRHACVFVFAQAHGIDCAGRTSCEVLGEVALGTPPVAVEPGRPWPDVLTEAGARGGEQDRFIADALAGEARVVLEHLDSTTREGEPNAGRRQRRYRRGSARA
jgi:hypothetical protein